MPNRWDESFSAAFTKAFGDPAGRAFEIWKLQQENDPEAIKAKARAQMQGMLAAYGMLGNDFSTQTSPVDFSVGSGDFNLPPLDLGSIGGIGVGGLPLSVKGLGKGGLTFGVDPLQQKMMEARIDLAKKQTEGKMATQVAVSKQSRFLKQFGRSYNELKEQYPEIGKKGFSGWATRKGAWISEKFDNLPETSAFLKRMKPMANEQARIIEGGRVTDQDRQVYADAMANVVASPSQTNIRIVSEDLLSLLDKGGNEKGGITQVVGELLNSDIDIMQQIALEVLKDSPDIATKLGINPDEWELMQ